MSKNNGTAIAEQPQAVMVEQRQRLPVIDHSNFANYLDTAKFEHLWRLAQAFSRSDLVPESFRNKPENCMIGIQMAIRCNVDPYMFLQKCYVVHGRPGIETQLAIAMLNASGLITGRIVWQLDGNGMDRRCTAQVTDKETRQVFTQEITMNDAKREGWIDKSGSKWKTIPDLMLKYRSAMWLIRLHYPEVVMGLQSKEELSDTIDTIPAEAPKLITSLRELAAQTNIRDDRRKIEPAIKSEATPPDATMGETVDPAEIDVLDKIDELHRQLGMSEAQSKSRQQAQLAKIGVKTDEQPTVEHLRIYATYLEGQLERG